MQWLHSCGPREESPVRGYFGKGGEDLDQVLQKQASGGPRYTLERQCSGMALGEQVG